MKEDVYCLKCEHRVVPNRVMPKSPIWTHVCALRKLELVKEHGNMLWLEAFPVHKNFEYPADCPYTLERTVQ